MTKPLFTHGFCVGGPAHGRIVEFSGKWYEVREALNETARYMWEFRLSDDGTSVRLIARYAGSFRNGRKVRK